ncbi:TIR domain-containing protein [Geodermatophilus poikilotrophus]|uniref:WD40 repeat n=1 Tax=Geodermatophilus poikilotrophus TaxID=1333667 RepID=A0A1I0IEG6_9ACTN|nr:TIR domain-containing protein [Geodermatophilus poikilotrophus]SET95117.1 WD40 repeat [Geodermatophilus poikilotrophus]
MTSLFVSHSARDWAPTQQVREWLRSEGYAALFVDFDPDSGIGAGQDWERELYAQLRRCDGVVFLASSSSTASRWCFAELSLARALGKPVFPIRVEPATRMDLLDDVQWVDLAEGDAALDRLRGGLQRAGLDPADSFSWDPIRSPYPGLAHFEAADAAVFYGRGPETTRLLELLQPTILRGPGRFVGIVGPSGSGKSSLLRAGLLPRVTRLGTRWVVLPPVRPGSDPTWRLAGCLSEAFAAHGVPRSRTDVAADLGRGPDALASLAGELAELCGDLGEERPRVLVVVDQAEELLTSSGRREQQAFLHLLTGALRRERSPLWVVATLRSEFLTSAPERAGLAEAIDDPLVVEPLSRSRLPEVIAGPARRAGLDLDPGLVERMVEDTAGGDALPLLAYTLSELYDRVGPGGRIRSADYEAVGGVVGALQRRADHILDELIRRGLGPTVLPTLLQLAAVEHGEEPTRRRVEWRSLTDEERTVVGAFVEARLLVSASGTSDDAGEGTVEVAHEALLRQWPPLRSAIDDAREWLQRRSELDRLAADWEQGGRDESFLLRGGHLAAFDRWGDEHLEDLRPLERRFLESSREVAARELEVAHRTNRRLRILASGLAVFLVLALTAGGLAWRQDREAQAQARLALARQLSSDADRLVDSQPDTAILAGLHALGVAPRGTAPPAAGLVTALARVTHVSRTLFGHTNQVHGVAFTRDGRVLASGGGDGVVRLWDVATAGERATLQHGGEVWSVAFGRDDRLLASGGRDGLVRLWDPATGRPDGPALEHGAAVWSTAFSADGRFLASGGSDGVVRVWDVASRQPHGDPLTGGSGWVQSVAYSSTGVVAAAGDDGVVRMWDSGSGRLLHELVGHEDEVNTIAFSPDGGVLASGGWDATVRMWDTRTGEVLHTLPATSAEHVVRGLAFSADGALLASSSSDDTASVWSVASGQPVGQSFVGHPQDVDGLAFSPDGRQLATAGWDGTVRLWEVVETYSVSRAYPGHSAEVLDVDVSADGRLLATAGADGTARLWDVTSTRPHGPALQHDAPVNAVAFRPDGRVLASAGEDGVLSLWDVATGSPLQEPIAVSEHALLGVAFSPDGRLLVLGMAGGVVELWDAESRARHGEPLTGHVEDVNDVLFSPDGSLVASASTDGTARLWSAASGRPAGEPLSGHASEVYGVAFHPDGRVLATGGADDAVRLWDVGTGVQIGEPLGGHDGGVLGVAFSRDGRSLVSGSEDQSVRAWDVRSRLPRGAPLTGHEQAVTGVAFTPDGQQVASSSHDGAARLWDVDFSTWAQAGCGLIGRNMTMAEWTDLLPDLPYRRTCPGVPPGHGAPRNAPAAQ